MGIVYFLTISAGWTSWQNLVFLLTQPPSGLDARLKSNRPPYDVQGHVQEATDHANKQWTYRRMLENPKQFGGTLADINTANIAPVDPNPQNARLLYFCGSPSITLHFIQEYGTKCHQRYPANDPADGFSRRAEYAVRTSECNPTFDDAIFFNTQNCGFRGCRLSRNISHARYRRNSKDDRSQRWDTREC